MKGFILLQRQIFDWEWWSDINTYRLWTTILLLANFEDKNWHGIEVKRGQLITSVSELSKKTDLSVRNVRTALNHLISTGEITCETTNRYTLITIEKYDVYQFGSNESDRQDDNQSDNRPTSDRQTSDKQPTSDRQQLKELKELNNLNNINNSNNNHGNREFNKLKDPESMSPEELEEWLNETFEIYIED